MTDPLPPSVSDEDLSALLDGEAAPGVEARVAADPSAAHRLARLRDAAAVLAEDPPPLPEPAVDALIAAALGAAGPADAGPDDADDAPEDADPVRPLVPPTPRRSPRGGARWLVAAAILVLLGTGLALVWSGRSDRTSALEAATEQVATDADRSTTPTDGGAGDASTADQSVAGDSSASESAAPQAGLDDTDGADGAPTTVGPDVAAGSATTALVDLGPFADPEALRTAIAAGLPPDAPVATGDPTPIPATASIDRCADQLDEVLGRDYELGDPAATAVALATIDGTEVIVYELPIVGGESTGATLVAAVDAVTCDPAFILQR